MTEEVLSAKFVADDAPFGRGVGRILGHLDNLLSRSLKVSQGVVGSFDKSSQAAGRFTDANGRAREANGRFASSGDKATGSLVKLAAGYLTAEKALQLLKQGLTIISDFQRLDAGLSNVSTSAIDFARTQSFVRGLSDELGVSIEVLSSSYRGLKAATNGTVLEGAQTQKIFAAIVRSGAALKLSNEDIQGSLLAVIQMANKGRVSMEEFGQQLGERLPGAVQIAARAMGTTEPELIKMITNGEVLAKDLLPKLADQLEKTYGTKAQSNIDSMAGGFTRLTDQMKLLFVEAAKDEGIDRLFSKLTNHLADYAIALREAQRRGESWLSLDFDRRVELTSQHKQSQKFGSASADDRSDMLSEQKQTSAGLRFKLQSSQLSGSERKKLEDLLYVSEERVNNMRRANLKLAVADRQEQERAAINRTKALAAPIDYSDALKKKKDEFGGLKDKKEYLNSVGKDLTGTDAKRYAQLSQELERGANAIKKQKALHEGTAVSLTTNESILKRLTRQLEQYGDTADNKLSRQVAGLKKLVEIDQQRASMKPVDLGESLKSIDRTERLKSILLQTVAPLQQVQGLLSRFGEIGQYRGIEYLQKQIESIRTKAAELSLKNLTLPQEALDKLNEYVKLLAKADAAQRNMGREVNKAQGEAYTDEANQATGENKWSSAKGIGKNFHDSAMAALGANRDDLILNAQDMSDKLVATLNKGAQGAAQAMGGFVGGLIDGTAGINELPGAVLGVVAQMLQDLAAALAASGAALAITGNPMGFAQLGASAGLFAAAGLARAAAQPKAKGYEKGGLFTGESTIRVAETPRARAGGGELVTSVESGTNLIGDRIAKRMNALTQLASPPRLTTATPVTSIQAPSADTSAQSMAEHFMAMGGLGNDGGGGTLTTRVSGSDLVFVFERAMRRKQSLGNG